MKSLIRTAVGNFHLDKALKLSEIEELVKEDLLESYIMPADKIFESYSKLNVDQEYHKLIYNGNSFRKEHTVKPIQEVATELIRVYDAEDEFIGIYRYDTEDDLYKPVKMFL
jgi:tRNA pseudouridine55 synthase